MASLVLSVLVTTSVWWWYFELKGEARRCGYKYKRMFRRQLILSWAVTIIAVVNIAYFFLGPGRYGEETWL